MKAPAKASPANCMRHMAAETDGTTPAETDGAATIALEELGLGLVSISLTSLLEVEEESAAAMFFGLC